MDAFDALMTMPRKAGPLYAVTLPGTAWTATGPTPDRVLSRHRTEPAARASFDRIVGPADLVEILPNGSRRIISRRTA